MNTIPIKDNGYDHMWHHFGKQSQTVRYVQPVRYKQLTVRREDKLLREQEKERRPYTTNYDLEEYREERRVFRQIRERLKPAPTREPTVQELFPWFFERTE